jgi:hypothetical protein
VDFVGIVQHNHVRFVLVNVDTECVHGCLWSGRAWTGETPMRASRPAAGAAGLVPMMVLPWHLGQSRARALKRLSCIGLCHPVLSPRAGALAGSIPSRAVYSAKLLKSITG